MRPLTLGIVVSDGALSAANLAEACSETASDNAVVTDPDLTTEGVIDLRSASDLIDAVEALGHRAVPLAAGDDLDLALRRLPVDACLLALHGRRGGTGDVQSLLSLRGVPHGGPCATATALAFDKVRSRQMLAYHNLPVPAAVAMGVQTRASERALQLLGWPCVVKPRRGAHGLGITHVRELSDVKLAVERAMDLDTELVLEREVSGREVQVVLLGDRVLGAAEVFPPAGGGADGGAGFVRRSAASGAGLEMLTPPEMSRGALDGITNLARRAVASLGLHGGVTRVDIVVHPRHNETIIEVEPLPPVHRESVVARVARAAGLAYEELVASMLDRIALTPRGLPRPEPRPLLQ